MGPTVLGEGPFKEETDEQGAVKEGGGLLLVLLAPTPVDEGGIFLGVP